MKLSLSALAVFALTGCAVAAEPAPTVEAEILHPRLDVGGPTFCPPHIDDGYCTTQFAAVNECARQGYAYARSDSGGAAWCGRGVTLDGMYEIAPDQVCASAGVLYCYTGAP